MRQTDSRGFNTYYDVDDETSRNMTVTDRCGNKTSYEYDDSGRTTKVTSRDSNGTALAHVNYGYDLNDNLVDITRGDGMSYNLAYNSLNRLESIAIDGMPRPLVAYNYKEGSGRLKEIEYANGSVMHVSYNRFGHPICEFWTDSCNCITAFYRYLYDNSGNITRSIDFINKIEYTYTYEEGRIIRSAVNEIEVNGYESVLSRTLKHTILYFYDDEGRLEQKAISDDSGQYSYTRNSYDENGNVSTVAEVCGSCATITSSEDGLGRKTSDTVSFENGAITRNFFYRSGAVTQEHIANNKVCGTATTNLVSKIHFSNGRVIEYWYDGEERITRIADSCEGETFYTYDALGQLTSETKNVCPECCDGETVNITYDNYGNILTKGNHTYGYDNVLWKDRLTSFDGQSITYDAQGNPTNYLGHTLTWEKGRQLKSFDGNTYTYNSEGIRISKTVDGIRHDYVVDGAKILKETWLDNTLIPIYNNDEEVIGIYYNCTPYYFYKNLQNDVIGVADADGTEVVTYTYDAWGVCTVLKDISGVGLANINPYRYRSYYYDTEIGMYYLQSRYYDPVVGRFINADDVMLLGASGTNLGYVLFAYCENNPVNNIDPDGHLVITTTMLICAGIGALVLGTIGGIGGYHLSKKWKVPEGKRWKYVLGGVVIGAVVGALIGGAVGYVIGPSTSSGIVLWSGNGNASVFQAASSFAKKNGLKVLEKTCKGRILNFMQSAANKLLGKNTAWKFMKPLWQAASQQFAKTGKGVVHVFLNASGINFESTFLTIEYWILRDLGVQMVFHLVD